MQNEMIAFRSIDQDGDIWCETAFIFESEEDVNKGLVKDSPMLINAFCDCDEPDDKTLQEFEVQAIGEIINSVTFYTEYAHEVRLVRMNKGYIYKPE